MTWEYDTPPVPLHPHQHDALVLLLRQPTFATLTADQAYALITSDKNFCGLRNLRWVSPAKYAALTARRPQSLLLVARKETREAFPGGIPGFPNKLCKAWLDRAWAEARQ